jgi:ELWxxDGT repeat protein
LNNRFLAAAAFALALPLSAQSPYLVKDINRGAAALELSSNPGGFMLDGNTVYFRATGEAGTALYKFDGVTTQLVKDINPGAAGGSLGRLVRVGSNLLFGATGSDGRELWQTDGTAAGTTLLKDINPAGESQASMLFALGSRGLLFANDGVHGTEPWITDGTAAGTQLLADTIEGPSSPVWWNTNAQVGGLAFLTATTGLWVTDGTTAGTIRLATGPAVILGTLGSTVIFRGFDAERGMELWKTDGTVAGTTLVKDIAPGVTGSYSTATAFAAGSSSGATILFFANDGAGNDLWSTDGSAGGTQKIFPFAPESASWRRMPEVSYAAGLWWFSTSEGSWRSDGTAAGTFEFTDFWPIRVESAFGKAYFLTLGDELFSTDGTAGGTTLIRSFDWHPELSEERVLTILGGKAYFGADQGISGIEPWVSEDGTAAGTRQIGNVMPEVVTRGRSSSPQQLTATGESILFTANDQLFPQNQIWTSDGTSGGTAKLATLERPAWTFARWNGSVVYSAGHVYTLSGPEPVLLATLSQSIMAMTEVQRGLLLRTSSQLWYTNATAAGTGRLTDDTGAELQLTSNLAEVAGRWYFVAVNTASGESALYTTEGTPETTVVAVADFPRIHSIYSAFGALYYDCTGICRLDPATGRTTFLKQTTSPSSWVAAGPYLYFESSNRLWRTDGTADGTSALDVEDSSWHTAAGNLLFFLTRAPGGFDLWRTDGTDAGTFKLGIVVGSPGTPSPLIGAGGYLWFTANHPSFGTELWRSDGTVAGTTLVADLEPGVASSAPGGFALAGSRLFFSAETIATGRELWAIPLAGPPVPAAPPVLDARGSATAVTLTWTASAAAAPVTYDVYRASFGSTLTRIGISSTTQFTDTAVTPGNVYLYRVVARDANGVLSPSNTDLASTGAFTKHHSTSTRLGEPIF